MNILNNAINILAWTKFFFFQHHWCLSKAKTNLKLTLSYEHSQGKGTLTENLNNVKTTKTKFLVIAFKSKMSLEY